MRSRSGIGPHQFGHPKSHIACALIQSVLLFFFQELAFELKVLWETIEIVAILFIEPCVFCRLCCIAPGWVIPLGPQLSSHVGIASLAFLVEYRVWWKGPLVWWNQHCSKAMLAFGWWWTAREYSRRASSRGFGLGGAAALPVWSAPLYRAWGFLYVGLDAAGAAPLISDTPRTGAVWYRDADVSLKSSAVGIVAYIVWSCLAQARYTNDSNARGSLPQKVAWKQQKCPSKIPNVRIFWVHSLASIKTNSDVYNYWKSANFSPTGKSPNRERAPTGKDVHMSVSWLGWLLGLRFVFTRRTFISLMRVNDLTEDFAGRISPMSKIFF